MKTCLITLLAVGTLLPAGALAQAREPMAGEVRIELRPQAQAMRHDVRLGDVAVVHTLDLETIQRLVALPLGTAPRPGLETVVRRDVIARWVRTQVGLGRDQVVWSGADETRIRSGLREVNGGRLESTARAALQDWLRQGGAHLHGELASTAPDVQVGTGEVAITARALPSDAEPGQRAVVWVDIDVDGERVRSVPVTFVLEASAANLPRDKAPGTAAKAPAPIVAAVPAQDAVASVPLVARGDWVVLQLRSGAVELERRTQALQDGRLGETVKVRGDNGPIAARITAAGRVEAML